MREQTCRLCRVDGQAEQPGGVLAADLLAVVLADLAVVEPARRVLVRFERMVDCATSIAFFGSCGLWIPGEFKESIE